MRANHLQRFVALIVDRTGRPTLVGKIALSTDGQRALEREASALVSLGRQLMAPLRPPDVVAHEQGILLTRAVAWQVRRTPWELPVEVASALGSFFRTTGNVGSGGAHGDCAPWNLLSSGGSWVLVDWESAMESAPPFHDVVHYLVQSHVLLGRPGADTILAGLDGRGWVGAAIRAYAGAAGLPAGEAIDHLLGYLRSQRTHHGSDVAPGDPASDARRRLLIAAERWAALSSLRATTAP
jgi:hypothetical protein